MARAASAVLSPADKKAQVVALRAQVKEFKTAASAANKEIKAQTKVVVASEKALAKLQDQLDKLTQKAA